MIKKILIIDDSIVARKMLKRFIPKDRGYELHEARDGRAGLEMFREINPDTTFLDLTMPVMDGVEALREIKKVDADAVVIVNTADVQASTIDQVIGLGALMVLKKPPAEGGVAEALARAEQALKVRL
jgi:two-component system chemotaxis response regulator CheY